MRIKAIVLRIIRQFIRDKRTLALMMVAPLLVLSLMYLVFNSNTYEPKIGTVDLPSPLIQALEKEKVHLTPYTRAEGEKALAANTIDALIALEGQAPLIRLEGSDPAKSRAVLLFVQHSLQALNPAAAQGVQPRVEYLYGSEDMASFDNFGSVLLGFFTFFFVFLLSGVSFLRERTGGTLERLMASPLRRYEIVTGYILGFGLFAFLQSLLIVWYSTKVLGMLMTGSFALLLLVTLILSLTALTLGLLISAFANNELQVIQFIPLIIIPQVFFSGLFNMDTMTPWLRGLGSIMPLTYGARALRDIMIRGKGWEAIGNDLLILLGFAAVFIVLNLLVLRKYRKV